MQATKGIVPVGRLFGPFKLNYSTSILLLGDFIENSGNLLFVILKLNKMLICGIG